MGVAADSFDFLTDQTTLWAVVLGALLATVGGFIATALERNLDRRERERNAALFFGEVLSTLSVILSYAEDTKKIGDPFGPITMQMINSARREIDIYDRNRESLYAIRIADLRARVQGLVIRLSMPLDGLIDAAAEIAKLRTQMRLSRDEVERADIETRIAEIAVRQENAFDFALGIAAQLKPTIAALEPLAHHSFERSEQVARGIRQGT